MKKILSFCFIGFSISLYSQITLTQSSYEPKPADLESVYGLDTSAFSTGLPLNVTGSTAVWNFSSLQAKQPVLDNYYFSPGSVPSSSNYPGCTVVQESGNLYTYIKSVTSPNMQTEVLGVSSNTLSLTFTNSAIAAKYPITFGSNSSDNLSGTFTFSVNGTCSGNIVTNADGSGTLNLPGGISLSNVLRVKSVQTLSLSAALFPPLPATQVGTLKQTIYNYYVSTQKFPVLSLNYSSISFIVSPTPTVTGFATGSTSYFVTGLNETELSEAAVIVYPNPVKTTLSIKTKSQIIIARTELYNHLGQIVLVNNSGNETDLTGLAPGVYILNIKTDQGIVRKKIIKE